jgi:hypothetical protein
VRGVCVVWAALQLGCATTSSPTSVSPDQVLFTSDEQSMERALFPIITGDGIVATLEQRDEDKNDAYVLTTWGDENTPSFRIIVDTTPAQGVDDQRVVYVFLYTDVQTTPAGRMPTLEIVNEINAGYWVGDLYVDDGGRLRGEWAVPVKAGTSGVSGLLVANIIHRYAGIWFDAYPQLARCPPCQVTPDDAAPSAPPPVAGEKQVHLRQHLSTKPST